MTIIDDSDLGTDQGLTLVLERRLNAAPATVWRAFTDPAVLARWWGPAGFTVPAADVDCRVGGSYRIEMLGESGYCNTITGAYKVVEPPRRLVMSWTWEQDSLAGVEMEVEISLAPDGPGTRLLVEHRGLPRETARDSHRDGWNGGLARLEAMLAASEG